MSDITNKQRQAIAAVVSAVLESIRAAGPMGAPSGVLYAALMAHGATLSQYQSLMNALERAGRVRAEGGLYFIA